MISVIICCYNSSSRILDVLKHLENQDHPNCDWEVVLVDNCSTDGGVKLALNAWKHSSVLLRTVSEDRLGLTYARLRGIREALGEIVIFCDDDNWFERDYLKTVSDIFERHSDCGGVAGVGEAVANIPLPSWFENVKGYYACGPDVENDKWVTELTGAGMALRKAALNSFLGTGYQFSLIDRQGYTLSSGGDYEISSGIWFAGWKLLRTPRLCFRHYMPESRLNESYLWKLCLGLGTARPGVILMQQEIRKRTGNIKLSDKIPFAVRAAAAMLRGFICCVPAYIFPGTLIRAKAAYNIGIGLGYLSFLRQGLCNTMAKNLSEIQNESRCR